MRLELKRTSLIIVPETDQDRAFIEDTLSLKDEGAEIKLARVSDVSMGFKSTDAFVLKIGS